MCKKTTKPDHSNEKLIDILKNNVKYSSEPPNHCELVNRYGINWALVIYYKNSSLSIFGFIKNDRKFPMWLMVNIFNMRI